MDTRPTTTRGQSAGLIEQRSIDHVPGRERHGKVWHQGPFWFTGNFVFTTVVTGHDDDGVRLSLAGAS